MITLKSAYQLRALTRKAIELAKESIDGVGSISSTKSSLGISVDLSAGSRTVNTYIGDNYIEISPESSGWIGNTRNLWGDNTHKSEWWGNGEMPDNPCEVTLDAFEESVFQFEVLHSGSMLESSMYGLIISSVLLPLLEGQACLIMQLHPFGLRDIPINPYNVNDLIDDVYFKHFKTSEVPYV